MSLLVAQKLLSAQDCCVEEFVCSRVCVLNSLCVEEFVCWRVCVLKSFRVEDFVCGNDGKSFWHNITYVHFEAFAFWILDFHDTCSSFVGLLSLDHFDFSCVFELIICWISFLFFKNFPEKKKQPEKLRFFRGDAMTSEWPVVPSLSSGLVFWGIGPRASSSCSWNICSKA